MMKGLHQYDMDPWRDRLRRHDWVRWILRHTACRALDHRWQTKMYDKFCIRCGSPDPGFYQGRRRA